MQEKYAKVDPPEVMCRRLAYTGLIRRTTCTGIS
jgi:hypothetical protein